MESADSITASGECNVRPFLAVAAGGQPSLRRLLHCRDKDQWHRALDQNEPSHRKMPRHRATTCVRLEDEQWPGLHLATRLSVFTAAPPGRSGTPRCARRLLKTVRSASSRCSPSRAMRKPIPVCAGRLRLPDRTNLSSTHRHPSRARSATKAATGEPSGWLPLPDRSNRRWPIAQTTPFIFRRSRRRAYAPATKRWLGPRELLARRQLARRLRGAVVRCQCNR